MFDIDGIVFDLDGTLIDSIECYFDIFREAAAPFGLRVRREDVLVPMATGSDIWERAVPFDTADRDRVLAGVRKAIPGIFKKVMDRTRVFPGVAELLEELDARGVRLSLLTASWRPALEPLKREGLLKYFGTVLSHEDGFTPKPSPDGVFECLRRMDLPASRVLMVGDSPLDVRAGKGAGAWTAAVLGGVATREQLEAETPDALLENAGRVPAALGPKTAENHRLGVSNAGGRQQP